MNKKVPLTYYDSDGNRHIIGDAVVQDDGSFVANVTEPIIIPALEDGMIGPQSFVPYSNPKIDMMGEFSFGMMTSIAAPPNDDPCTEETYSLWHFNDQQVDGYWIRCTRVGFHFQHEDENTGLVWPEKEEEKVDQNAESPINPAVAEGFQAKARLIVFEYVKARLEKTDTHVKFGQDDVYLVWFSKTLQNWKALASTNLPDGMYYEITYNGNKRETYLDAYKKFDNVCIRDGDMADFDIDANEFVDKSQDAHGRSNYAEQIPTLQDGDKVVGNTVITKDGGTYTSKE